MYGTRSVVPTRTCSFHPPRPHDSPLNVEEGSHYLISIGNDTVTFRSCPVHYVVRVAFRVPRTLLRTPVLVIWFWWLAGSAGGGDLAGDTCRNRRI
jgi:hypothetical protein